MANNVITKLENLNLMDKFLFDEAMEDRETYQAVVSILLENEVGLLEKPETEKELRVSPQLRQIRLDVSLLEPGCADFNLLNDSCFILIAPFDIFGRGLYRYTFEGMCKECPDLKLEDGAVRVFINTKGTNREDFSGEFLDFMEYITASTDEQAEKTESRKIKIIHENVRRIRTLERKGVRYMQRWEELYYARQDGIEEGRAEGKAEGKMSILVEKVCKKLAKNKTPEEISEDLEEELATILPICEIAEEFFPDYDCEQVTERYFELFPVEQNAVS